MLSVADLDPKGTNSEVRVHAGLYLDLLDADRSPNPVRFHVGTTQVDFEVDCLQPANSPAGDLLITMVEESVILYKKEFPKWKKSYLSLIWKWWKREMTARLPATLSSVQTWFFMKAYVKKSSPGSTQLPTSRHLLSPSQWPRWHRSNKIASRGGAPQASYDRRRHRNNFQTRPT